MRRILTSVVLLVLLFPSLAMSGEVTFDDLVKTRGLYYKKLTDVTYTGRVTGTITQEDLISGVTAKHPL